MGNGLQAVGYNNVMINLVAVIKYYENSNSNL